MPRLLWSLMRRYMEEQGGEGGEGGGGSAPAPAPAAAPAAEAPPPPAPAPGPAAAPPAAGEEGAEATAGTPSAELLADLGISAAEFAQLPDGERQALLADDEGDPARDEELERLAAAAAPAPGPAAPPPPAAAPGPAAAPPAGAPAAETAAAPAAEPPPAPAPAQRWVPYTEPEVTVDDEMMVPPTVAFTREKDARLTAATGEMQQLLDDFEEGRLTPKELGDKRRALQAEIDTLNREKVTAEATWNMYNTQVDARFRAEVTRTLNASRDQGGINYFDPANKDKYAELNGHVQRLGRAADHLYPNRPQTWRDRWALGAAVDEMERIHGVKRAGKAPPPPAPAPGPAAAPPPAAKAPPAPAPGAARTPPLAQVPPTLRGAPAAADSHIQGGEFDYLDNMSPSEAERVVATFDEAKLDRYLAR